MPTLPGRSPHNKYCSSAEVRYRDKMLVLAFRSIFTHFGTSPPGVKYHPMQPIGCSFVRINFSLVRSPLFTKTSQGCSWWDSMTIWGKMQHFYLSLMAIPYQLTQILSRKSKNHGFIRFPGLFSGTEVYPWDAIVNNGHWLWFLCWAYSVCCVCVCVCVCDRERERESVCVCVCVCDRECDKCQNCNDILSQSWSSSNHIIPWQSIQLGGNTNEG